MTEVYEKPDLSDVPAKWGHEPTVHGDELVWPGRAVLLVQGRTWPYQPEVCPDETERGEWLFNGMILVCPGCGLDCT